MQSKKIKHTVVGTMFLALIACFIVVNFFPAGTKINYLIFYALLFLGSVASLILYYLPDEHYYHKKLFFILTPLIIFYISILIYFSGGMESQLFTLYLLPLIFASVYQQLLGALYSFVLIAISYVAIFYISTNNTTISLTYSFEILSYHLRIFLLVAFFSGYLAKREKAHKEKMKKILKDVIQASAHILDVKSFYSFGHAEEVMKISLLTADKFVLNDKQKDELRISALFHDVGISEIRDEILEKKENLSEVELKELQQNPHSAVKLLSAEHKGMEDVVNAIYYLHEKYDGSGYPEGLKGENIPLLSRIIAVAESYSAMKHDRPYRSKKDEKEIIKEIKSLAGIQFDPKIVEIFLQVIE